MFLKTTCTRDNGIILIRNHGRKLIKYYPHFTNTYFYVYLHEAKKKHNENDNGLFLVTEFMGNKSLFPSLWFSGIPNIIKYTLFINLKYLYLNCLLSFNLQFGLF